jgi:hypothetical protein
MDPVARSSARRKYLIASGNVEGLVSPSVCPTCALSRGALGHSRADGSSAMLDSAVPASSAIIDHRSKTIE